MYRSLLAECNYIPWDNPLEDAQLWTCSMAARHTVWLQENLV